MKWKECAITDLRKYSGMKDSLKNIPEKIHVLELRFQSVKGASSDTTPVTGGESHMEDALLDNIVERERLKVLYQADLRMVRLIERGLKSLSEEEQTVLNMFYINRTDNYIDKLMKDLKYEKSQIYRIKDEAVYKFTINMYGIEEY